jgi:PAS domain S-box-containing protein
MPDSATANKLTRLGAPFARRYGLAFASVAGALLLDLLFNHFNLPHPFAAFALSAIAITFWYGGTKPGIVAVLLSSLIRGFIFEDKTSSLSRVLYELVFVVFAILMIWVRRRKEVLEIAIVDRTAKLTAANEDLLRQKEQLDGLFELSPDAVILTDDAFHVLRVNKEFTRIFGYTAEEVAGHWLPDLIVPGELRAESLNYRDRLSSGNRVELETIRQRKDGVRFDVSVVARGISLGFGHGAVYLIYRDITEHKKAERELRRSEGYLAEAQKLTHTGSWAWNVRTGVLFWSREIFSIYDYEYQEIGSTWPQLLERVHPEDRPVVEEIFRRAQLDRTDYDASYRIVLPDGSIKHIYSVAHPVMNQSGELVEFVGTSMDVTEHWKARAELEQAFEEIKQRTEAARRSERELRDVVNTVPAHVWRTSPEGQVDFVNDRWLQFTGSALDEAFGWKWETVLHPDDRTRVVADWHAALKHGQAMESEARVRRADGEYCWWLIRNAPLRDETGKLLRWYGTAIDIEDRKRAEEALRKSEERWRSVFENSAIGVALTDLNGRFLATNHVYQTIVGYTEEELHALYFLDVTHKDYREANWALITELLEGKRRQFQIEKKYLRKDGSSIWVSNNVSLVPGTERVPRFIMALSEDITQRKRAEEALQRSEGYLVEAQKLTHIGSWAVRVPQMKDAQREAEQGLAVIPGFGWDASYWSREMYQIFGFDPDPVPPSYMEVVQRFHPEDARSNTSVVEQAIHDGTDFETDFRLLLPNGTAKYIHVVGHPVMNGSGDVIELVGTAMDVTEQHKASAALQRSEAFLAEGQTLSHTGSFGWNVLSGETYWSEETHNIFQYDRPVKPTLELVLQRVHPDDRDLVQQNIHDASENGADLDFEHRLMMPDGSLKYLHVLGRALKTSAENLEFVGAVTDVTAAKQAEEELRHREAELLEAQRLSHTGSWKHDIASGRVTVSPEVYRIYGVGPDEVMSNTEFWLNKNHPEDAKRIEELFEECEIQKTDYEANYRIVLPDGAVRHLHAIGHPIVNEKGDLVEFVGTAMDVTEQHEARAALQTAFEQLKAEETELRRMTDAIASYIYVLRPDGTAFYANQTLLDYTGLTLEDVQREDQRARVFHPEDLERLHEERHEALARGKPFELEQRALGKDGKYRWFLVRYNPLRDDHGNIIRWYATGTDIEDRKQAEERMRDENLALREQIDQAFMFEDIVGSSSALQAVLSSIVKVAPADSTVLITGETGTGKELIARAIHKHSQRSGQAFISVNCASIPSSLIASELFGHEKGAFTGAVQRRQGRFELAHSGTIFLDEVGDLPAETQIALLRVLQERQFERVGGTRTLATDVRVIAATNRDLTAAIAAGTFRADLFYRLNVFPIEVPPLRERKEDIPMLVEYFVKRYAENVGKQICKIDLNTLELCQAYSWPGNIRELQNIVERSVILTGGDTFSIEKAWLACPEPARQELPSPLPDTLQNQEREIIEAALAECKGRVAGPKGAAAKLGIPRSTLDSKIKQLKIKKHKFHFEQ